MDLLAALKSSKDIEFQDVYYTVSQRKNFVQEVGKQNILNGVSGAFRNGCLSAIMGPSGAGKSSLLNAVSGYRTSGVKGLIRLNRNESCYITQEDNHQPLLTVEELMHLSCALKLVSRETYSDIITNILSNLNLNHRRNVTSENLSGGERKRLSIALELVANPKILFLDEPTTGLDEVTALSCVRVLKALAQQGRTIVCTIHQPSLTIFNQFNNLYVLAKGNCVYQGDTQAVIQFLSYVNLDCPKQYSPSDYIIEICDFDEGQNIPFLAETTQNGKLFCELPSNSDISSGDRQIKSNNIVEFKNALRTLHLETPKILTSHSFIGNAFLEKMKTISKRKEQRTLSTSSYQQFCILLRVMMLKVCRNKIALWIQFVHHIMCGLLFGTIFFGTADMGERMFEHLKYCIGTIMMIVYTQVMVPILSYPTEVKMMKKEYFNRWYSLTPYYLALTLSRIPFQIIFNSIFLSLAYWMTGLPSEYWRFTLFVIIGWIISFAADGMGLAIGATFKVTNGAIVGPLLIAPFTGLAVYGFDFAAEISTFMYMLMRVSYIRVGSEAMVLTIFGFDRKQLSCNEVYCHFSDPKVLLKFLDIENMSIWHEIGFLLLIMAIFRILLYISLKKRCGT